MAAGFLIYGQSMVLMEFGDHSELYGLQPRTPLQLGLSVSEGIRISPRIFQQDLHTNDYGMQVPVEVQVHQAEVEINMKLIYYDKAVLSFSVAESMGGFVALSGSVNSFFGTVGVLQPGGSLIGNNVPLMQSGCHFMSMKIATSQYYPSLGITGLSGGFQFPTVYLKDRPTITPVGVAASVVEMNWRAIPYYQPYRKAVATLDPNIPLAIQLVSGVAELVASGRILWQENLNAEVDQSLEQ